MEPKLQHFQSESRYESIYNSVDFESSRCYLGKTNGVSRESSEFDRIPRLAHGVSQIDLESIDPLGV